MMGHKICFSGEMWLIIPKLSLLPLLIWSTEIIQGQRYITFKRANSECLIMEKAVNSGIFAYIFAFWQSVPMY